MKKWHWRRVPQAQRSARAEAPDAAVCPAYLRNHKEAGVAGAD